MRRFTGIVAIALVASLLASCAPKPSPEAKKPASETRAERLLLTVPSPSKVLDDTSREVWALDPRGAKRPLRVTDVDPPVLVSDDGRRLLFERVESSMARLGGRARARAMRTVFVRDIATGREERLFTGYPTSYGFAGEDAIVVTRGGPPSRVNVAVPFVAYRIRGSRRTEVLSTRSAGLAFLGTHDGRLYFEDDPYSWHQRSRSTRIRTMGPDGLKTVARPGDILALGEGYSSYVSSAVSRGFLGFGDLYSSDMPSILIGRLPDLETVRTMARIDHLPVPGRSGMTPTYKRIAGWPVFDTDYTRFLQARLISGKAGRPSGWWIVEVTPAPQYRGKSTTARLARIRPPKMPEARGPIAYLPDGDFLYHDGTGKSGRLMRYDRKKKTGIVLSDTIGPEVQYVGATRHAEPR